MTPPEMYRAKGWISAEESEELLRRIDELRDYVVSVARIKTVLNREGMVTVYGSEGEYLGCMGRERWEELLISDREAQEANA